MHRYHLKYGDRGGYVVRDSQLKGKPVVFRSQSKSAAIGKAQEMNGFTPVDGNESTYARQIIDAKASIGH